MKRAHHEAKGDPIGYMRVFLLLVFGVALVAQTTNKLTPKEIADGWVLLYDGESSFGWTPEGDTQWQLSPEAELEARSGDSGLFRFNTLFGDYELRCELKNRRGTQSGLMLDGVAVPMPPKAEYHWYSYDAFSINGHLTVTLNGRKVVDQPSVRRGEIALRYTKGEQFSVRDFKLRPFGLKLMFGGKSLKDWTAAAIDKGAVDLTHETACRDFVLQMDMRKPVANAADDLTHPLDAYQRQPPVMPDNTEFVSRTMIAHSGHLTIWINGYLVTDSADLQPPDGIAASETAKLTRDAVCLQAHNGIIGADSRNIRIAELN